MGWVKLDWVQWWGLPMPLELLTGCFLADQSDEAGTALADLAKRVPDDKGDTDDKSEVAGQPASKQAKTDTDMVVMDFEVSSACLHACMLPTVHPPCLRSTSASTVGRSRPRLSSTSTAPSIGLSSRPVSQRRSTAAFTPFARKCAGEHTCFASTHWLDRWFGQQYSISVPTKSKRDAEHAACLVALISRGL